MKKQGFTIVELLVIIVVIGILASISVFAYNGVQAKARDADRISDLEGIADAIKLYRLKNGNDIQSGSGCGGSGNGNGWFAFENSTTYPKSILKCLIEADYLNESFIDPSSCVTTSVPVSGKTCSPSGHTYMKYSCGSGDNAITYLYTRLETSGNSQDLINKNVCSSATVGASPYFMNYMVVVD